MCPPLDAFYLALFKCRPLINFLYSQQNLTHFGSTHFNIDARNSFIKWRLRPFNFKARVTWNGLLCWKMTMIQCSRLFNSVNHEKWCEQSLTKKLSSGGESQFNKKRTKATLTLFRWKTRRDRGNFTLLFFVIFSSLHLCYGRQVDIAFAIVRIGLPFFLILVNNSEITLCCWQM